LSWWMVPLCPIHFLADTSFNRYDKYEKAAANAAAF